MTSEIDPIIRRYSAGEISAMQAASLFGGNTNVGDVIFMLRQAGLPPPRPTLEQEAMELAHARRVLHLGGNS